MYIIGLKYKLTPAVVNAKFKTFQANIQVFASSKRVSRAKRNDYFELLNIIDIHCSSQYLIQIDFCRVKKFFFYFRVRDCSEYHVLRKARPDSRRETPPS